MSLVEYHAPMHIMFVIETQAQGGLWLCAAISSDAANTQDPAHQLQRPCQLIQAQGCADYAVWSWSAGCMHGYCIQSLHASRCGGCCIPNQFPELVARMRALLLSLAGKLDLLEELSCTQLCIRCLVDLALL